MKKLEREERLIELIRRGHAVREVARLEGIDHDYAYKLLTQTAQKHGLEYQPRRVVGRKEIHGLTNESKALRALLGDELYKLELTATEAARAVGIPVKAQKYARDRPFNHDWSLSQIERLARERGITFGELLLKAHHQLQKA